MMLRALCLGKLFFFEEVLKQAFTSSETNI